mgnify:FL=1
MTVTELLPTPPLPLMMNSLCLMALNVSAMTFFCKAIVMGMEADPFGAPPEHEDMTLSSLKSRLRSDIKDAGTAVAAPKETGSVSRGLSGEKVGLSL